MTKVCTPLLVCLALSSLSIYAFQSQPNQAIKVAQKTLRIQMPIGLGESLWRQRIPRDNPMSSSKVILGETLFFDKRLSINGTVSCATCHDPALAFTDAKVVAIGAGDSRGTRNTPTILNAVFNDSFFWDGRVRSLEEQAKQPLMSSFEMGMGSNQELISRLSAIPEYERQFRKVFKSEGVTLATIAKAIAAYERTLISGKSPFDRFISGNGSALTKAQKRGWELFKGKAKCIECHAYSSSSPFFTDFKFHNTGIGVANTLLDELVKSVSRPSREASLTMLAHSAEFSALGRYAVTFQTLDVGAFKTPTLRNVELTSPYMHDGSVKTLIDVVQFYNQGGNANSYLDRRIHPLRLTDNEVNDLVQFMRGLTSDDILTQCQTTTPQTRTAVQVK